MDLHQSGILWDRPAHGSSFSALTEPSRLSNQAVVAALLLQRTYVQSNHSDFLSHIQQRPTFIRTNSGAEKKAADSCCHCSLLLLPQQLCRYLQIQQGASALCSPTSSPSVWHPTASVWQSKHSEELTPVVFPHLSVPQNRSSSCTTKTFLPLPSTCAFLCDRMSRIYFSTHARAF